MGGFASDVSGYGSIAALLALGYRDNPGLVGAGVPAGFQIINNQPSHGLTNPLPTTTYAATYYLRTTGDDGNDGLTVGNAVRTMDRVFNLIDALAGVYTEASVDIGPGIWYEDEVYPATLNRFPYYKNINFVGDGKSTTRLINAKNPASVSWTDNADGTYTATITGCL